MSIHQAANVHQAISAAARLERPARMTTGLIIFAFVTSHFLSHTFGVRSIDAMHGARRYLIMPWQTFPGLSLLYGALVTHALLGLYALHRRRHLRIPAGEAWQLALGLAIPLLLIQHAGSIRVGTSLYQMQFGYDRILYEMWVLSPENVMRRQLLLLLVAWIHACIGLRSFLRTRSWYRRLSSVLASVATLVPALALVGSSAPVSTCVTRSPTLSRLWSPRRLPRPARCTELSMGSRCSISGWCSSHSRYSAGDAGTRVVRARSRSPIRAIASSRCRLGFPCSRRAAGLPHASVCGGRSRCSTCRIRVFETAAMLAPLGPVELRTLQRIAAPPNVRLACQLRPSVDVSVVPLVPAGPDLGSGALRFDAGVEGGRELPIAAMFVDMRGSTRLATGRLPYLTAGDRLQFDTDGSADDEKNIAACVLILHDPLVTGCATPGALGIENLDFRRIHRPE